MEYFCNQGSTNLYEASGPWAELIVDILVEGGPVEVEGVRGIVTESWEEVLGEPGTGPQLIC